MSEASRTLRQQTLPGFSNAISSPESEDGPKPCNSPAGRQIGPCGPAPAHASLSARQALARGLMTRDTYGPCGDGSLTNADLSPSLASRLRARTDVNGSPEYVLTWTYWDMPQGPPIYALLASERRRSGNGCTGWPTPKTSDDRIGMTERVGGRKSNLNDMATTAGWATPTARDHKDGEFCPNVPTNALLGRQAWTAGCPAATEKRGALNPALPRWLMGYRAVWDSCGATAMQSFRKSRRRSSKRQ